MDEGCSRRTEIQRPAAEEIIQRGRPYTEWASRVSIVAKCSRNALICWWSSKQELANRLCRHLRQESISGAMNRLKMFRASWFCFQFSTQLQYVVINRTSAWITVVSPHFVEKLIP